MNDVEDMMAIMISVTSRSVSDAYDLIIRALRGIADRRGGLTNKVSDAGKRAYSAVTKYMPNLGTLGEVKASVLRQGDEQVNVARVERADLLNLKKALSEREVSFHVLENDDGTACVMFKARDFDLMNDALLDIGREFGITDEDIRIATTCLDNKEVAKEHPELKQQIENEQVEQLAGKHFGLDWHSEEAIDKENLNIEPGSKVLKAESGIYDIAASPDGSWTVSTAGEAVAEKQCTDGGNIQNAMIDSAVCCRDIQNTEQLKQGIAWQKNNQPTHAAKVGVDEKAAKAQKANINPEHTIANVAKSAKSRAEEHAKTHKKSVKKQSKGLKV